MDNNPNNPLHGVTLEMMLEYVFKVYGWAGLGERVTINCFLTNPSMKSSLVFLRKTQWARMKVEDLYLETKRNIADKKASLQL